MNRFKEGMKLICMSALTSSIMLTIRLFTWISGAGYLGVIVITTVSLVILFHYLEYMDKRGYFDNYAHHKILYGAIRAMLD